MNDDPANLDRLHDIVVAPPVPWWPPAPGWWVLALVLTIAATATSLRAWRTWRANAYRRSALRELYSATHAAQIAEVLKRTALVAYPREQVAAMCGSAWAQWLGETSGQPVPASVAHTLSLAIYQDEHQDEHQDDDRVAESTPLVDFAAYWIKHHAPAGSSNSDGHGAASANARGMESTESTESTESNQSTESTESTEPGEIAC